MATNCKKCGMLKFTDNSKCACNVKKFDATKLSKNTRTEKKPTELKRSPVKQVSEKRKERIANGGSEINLFKNIYKKKFKAKKNFCIICREELTEENISPASFPHILPKGTYPELRLLESNLQYLVCGIDHHDKFDEIIREVKKDIGLEELKKIILSGKTLDIKKYLDYEN